MDASAEVQDETTETPLTLSAEGLTRRAADRVLLDDVSLCLGGGDRFAVVGPTGSGKTLLLRALASLDPLDGGRLLLNGQEVSGDRVPAYRSRVVYLHQRPSLMEGRVEDVLRAPFSLYVHRQHRFDVDFHLTRLCSLGRDDGFLKKRARDLSGGESQIVALLRALQLDPDALLLDEPTAALDPHSTTAVERLVHDWLDERPSRRFAVWVTHDVAQARRAADRSLEMDRGRLRSEKAT